MANSNNQKPINECGSVFGECNSHEQLAAPEPEPIYILFGTVGKDLIPDSRAWVCGAFGTLEEARAAADPDDLEEYGCQCIMKVTGTHKEFVVGDGGQVLS